MKNLQEATEHICDLKGSLVAMDALLCALVAELPAATRSALQARFAAHSEVARTVLVHTPISEHTLAAFERDSQRITTLIDAAPGTARTTEP